MVRLLSIQAHRPVHIAVARVGRAFNWAAVKPAPTTRLRFLEPRWRPRQGVTAGVGSEGHRAPYPPTTPYPYRLIFFASAFSSVSFPRASRRPITRIATRAANRPRGFLAALLRAPAGTIGLLGHLVGGRTSVVLASRSEVLGQAGQKSMAGRVGTMPFQVG